MATSERQEAKGFSPFVCACFTLNYIIGTGFLALPWAFERAGILLSGVCMIIICVVANIASDYILTAMARCEALKTKLNSGVLGTPAMQQERCLHPDEQTTLLSNRSREGRDEEQDANNNIDKRTTLSQASPSGREKPAKTKIPMDCDESYLTTTEGKLLVGERKFDIPEMCQFYLGDKGLKAYGIAVTLDIYGFLWAYTSVFASAMAKALPLFADDLPYYWYRDSYPVYVFIFACIVVPISLLELNEQASLQVSLSACRIVMMLCMVLTPLAATYCGVTVTMTNTDTDITDQEPATPHFGDQLGPHAGDSSWINFSNIHQMIPIIVFCTLFHQAVPGLAAEVNDKSKLHTIFGLTFVLCGLCYSLIGVMDSYYFGSDILQSANLNWRNYHGGTGQLLVIAAAAGGGQEHAHEQWVDVALWANALSFFVVVFPALDVISAFPLNAFVLGNNLMDVTYKESSTSVVSHSPQVRIQCRQHAFLWFF
jgi:amino acid permease